MMFTATQVEYCRFITVVTLKTAACCSQKDASENETLELQQHNQNTELKDTKMHRTAEWKCRSQSLMGTVGLSICTDPFPLLT